jgi:glutathione S-transferase
MLQWPTLPEVGAFGMLTVYKFGPIGRCPDISPFVIKLETWLRMAGIPYAAAYGKHVKQPLGKLPAVLDDGVVIPDSSLIIEHLQRKHGDPLREARLDAQQRAMREAMCALIESRLYWVGYCLRWNDDANFEAYKPALRHYAEQTATPLEASLLRLIEPIAFAVVRRQCRRQAWEQGMGRFDRQQLLAQGITGWQAVSDFLADKPFMLGEQPSALDATTYGSLDSCLGAQVFHSPVHDFIASRENLVAYWQRLGERYWWPKGEGDAASAPLIAAAA